MWTIGSCLINHCGKKDKQIKIFLRIPSFFFCYHNQPKKENEMPNFGKLTQDLNGGTLSIGDNLVIDTNLNMHIGNIAAGNVFCTLFTSKLVEQTSQSGIHVYGNLHIENGFYLTGDFKITNETFDNLNVNGTLSVSGSASISEDLTVDQTLKVLTLSGLTTGLGPTIKGNTTLMGGLIVTGPDLVVPQLICDTICTEVAILNTVTPKTGQAIEVFGNVHLIDDTGSLYVNSIYGQTQSTITAHGNLIVTGPNLTVPYLVCPDLSPGSTGGGQIQMYGNLVLAGSGVHVDASQLNCNRISPLAFDGTITMTGNVDITGNCLTLAKQNGGPSLVNIVYTSKSAGVVTYYTDTTINPLEFRSITLVNPCIKSDSIVMVSIGNSASGSLFILSQIQVSSGQVVITFFNLVGVINIGDLIPFQYIIH